MSAPSEERERSGVLGREKFGCTQVARTRRVVTLRVLPASSGWQPTCRSRGRVLLLRPSSPRSPSCPASCGRASLTMSSAQALPCRCGCQRDRATTYRARKCSACMSPASDVERSSSIDATCTTRPKLRRRFFSSASCLRHPSQTPPKDYSTLHSRMLVTVSHKIRRVWRKAHASLRQRPCDQTHQCLGGCGRGSGVGGDATALPHTPTRRRLHSRPA